MAYYLDSSKGGYLSPEIQLRNLKLFGAVTSEKACRQEHESYMHERRKAFAAARQEKERLIALISDNGSSGGSGSGSGDSGENEPMQ
jgi:hypothetical protein